MLQVVNCARRLHVFGRDKLNIGGLMDGGEDTIVVFNEQGLNSLEGVETTIEDSKNTNKNSTDKE